ncbi:MAG: hypothetical protein IPH18_00590 [Chitinophagaceae bacterium]|nr:hypothetical protein [Chitinophagaceae bacterium]
MSRIRTWLFALAFTDLLNSVAAQDIKTAAGYFDKGELEKAKSAIDAAVSGTESGKPSVWIWKHKVYKAIGNSPTLKTKHFTALWESYLALKKAADLPGFDEAYLREFGTISYNKTFEEYYNGYIEGGSKLMNEGKFIPAYYDFSSAQDVSSFFYKRKLISSDLDTMITFYAGYCAMKGEDTAGAAANFQLLEAKTVCEKGLSFYPGDEYLLSVKQEISRQTGDEEGLFGRYEQKIKNGTAVFTDYLSYGADLYDYLFVEKEIAGTSKSLKELRMVQVLKKGLELNNKSGEANYLLGMYYTGKAMELQNEKMVLDTEANDYEAKKDEIQKKITINANISVQHLEAAVALLAGSTTESKRQNYKGALSQLVNLYKFMHLPEMQKAVEEKLKTL